MKYTAILFLLLLSHAALAWQDDSERQAAAGFSSIVAAVKQDDYKAVDYGIHQMVWQSKMSLLGYQPFEAFIDGGTPNDDPIYLAHLDQWIHNHKETGIALLLHAAYNYKHAWFVRGNHYAVQVPYAKMREFIDDMRTAADDIAYSLEIGGSVPYSRLLQLRIAKNNGDDDDTQRIFDEAIAEYPGFYPLYAERLTQLTPLWGGTTKAMIAFVDQHAANLRENSPLHILPVLLYERLVHDMEFNCMIYPVNKMPLCVLRYKAILGSSHMEAMLDDAFGFYAHADREEYNRVVVLGMLNSKALFQPPYDRIIEIASKTLSDDYAFNLNRANFYSGSGKYAQALDYYTKAIEEISSFPFPSERERAGWMAEALAQRDKAQAALSAGGDSPFRNQ